MADDVRILCEALGRRTAWSCTVVVHERSFSARYWYNGENLNNPREDAAEVALNWLRNPWLDDRMVVKQA
jgi:hypothetical protein